MHLADAFIQSVLQCTQVIHLYYQHVCSLGIEPTTFALLTQCSTTEPQEHYLLVNNQNISLLFPPDTFIVITFSEALQEAVVHCVRLNAEPFSCADSKHRRAALQSRHGFVSFHQSRAAIVFHH